LHGDTASLELDMAAKKNVGYPFNAGQLEYDHRYFNIQDPLDTARRAV
jgi:hypothetical protein